MRAGKASAWLIAAAAWLGPASPAHPGDLRLEPISLTLAAGEDSTTLWLSNTGPDPLQAQVRLFAWNQGEGGELLTPTRELAVSPPLIEVPPQGRQRVRVVRLAAGAPAGETAYRLIVDELPGGAPMGSRGESLLRYSIPVFASAGSQAEGAHLSARIERDAAGVRRLRLENSGGRHARVARLTFVAAGGRRHVLAPNLAGYVLAGRYKVWPLPGDLDDTVPGRFEADVNGDAVVLVPEPALFSGR
ncbi:fimbrial biogenesis chaperone [Pseudoxanthomonas sp. 10H]|uniref:fimbrial biogenesis chaperone n=1 Tax=Pseudoxanthomonas sp. 10H TaxID=3242729 RepID=UPI00355696A4